MVKHKVIDFLTGPRKTNNRQPALDVLSRYMNDVGAGAYGNNPQILVMVLNNDSADHQTSYGSNAQVSSILALIEMVKYRILREHVGSPNKE
jgi:hypothetical protein